jgi:Ca2+/Na+ antiporter
MDLLIYLLYYLVAIVALFLHFTGHLERWGMSWIIFLLALTVFPLVLYL